MSLSDGDVALLARQAVDLLSPDIEIDIRPAAGDDPYRWGRRAWLVSPVIDGRPWLAIYVAAEQTPGEALAHLIDEISNDVAQTERFWGVAFPRCPGHAHPAQVAVDGTDVVLRCPDTGTEIGRITPDLPH